MKYKSLIKNAVYNIIRTFVTLVFPLLIFIYASRILGPDGIGKVEFGKNIAGYFVLFASLGINNYGIREGARLRNSRTDFSRFVHEIIFINLISMTVSFLLYLMIIFSVPSLKTYRAILLVFSLTIFMTPMGVEWIYGALEEYRYIAIRTTVFQVCALVVLFFLVKDKDDIIWYSIVLIISSVGSNIMNIIHMWKFVDFKFLGKYQIKKHLSPILVLFTLAISNTLYSYIDITMLGVIVGDTEVGLYTAALKVNRIVVNVLGAVGAVVMPRLSYFWADNRKDEFEKITHMVVNVLLLISIPSCVGIFALSKQLLTFFCGKEYLNATLTMRILSFVIILLSLSTFFNMHILVPVNKEICTLKAIVTGLVTNMGINLFLIPVFGRNGAAIGTVIGESVVLFVGYYYARHVIAITGVLKNVWQYILASIPIYGLCICFERIVSDVFIQLIVSIILSVVLYTIILILLDNSITIFIIKFIRMKVQRKCRG